MKTFISIFIICASIQSRAQPSATAPEASDPVREPLRAGAYSLVQVGPHHRLWQIADTSVQSAGSLLRTQIVEIATGMHYWDGQGWALSDARFETNSEGFVAAKVQHKVHLSRDLGVVGAVKLTTPGGLLLQSTPVAICLFDAATGDSAIIGTVTNSVGVLIGRNQIVYENAFDGACADVSYAIDSGSFSQDVVFTGRLNPAAYGFPTNTTRIQIWTEFYQPPPADVITRPIYIEGDPGVRRERVSPDLFDETIGFDEFVLGLGRAYAFPSLSEPNGFGAPVAKQLVKAPDGRIFLIESVDYASIRQGLEALPDCAPAPDSGWHIRKGGQESLYASIPSPPKTGRTKRIAKAPRRANGVVVDYVATLGGNMNGTILFAADTNYFVSGPVFCNGPTTIEATVFKYQTNAFIQLNNTLICKTSQYRPAVFTGVDDSSVGQSCCGLPGANCTGVINPNGYANPAIYMAQASLSLTNFHFRYAQQAIRYTSPSGNTAASLNVCHSQFLNCVRGIELDFSGSGSGTGVIAVNMNNSLITGVQYPVYANAVGNLVSCTLANCTLDRMVQLVGGSGSLGVSLGSTNSIFASVTNTASGVTLAGDHNGFYTSAQQFGASQLLVSSSPFQTVGGAGYYLTDMSGFHNAGINAGNPAWLTSALKLRTTYPPIAMDSLTLTNDQTLSPQAQRDTDTVDLGFHYDPLDYIIKSSTFSFGTTRVLAGTAIATSGQGIKTLYDTFICQGSPSFPVHIVRGDMVQEYQWTAPSGLYSLYPQGYCTNVLTFTDLSSQVNILQLFDMTGSPNTNIFTHCQFHGGKFGDIYGNILVTNTLFERTLASLDQTTQVGIFRNCTFIGSELDLSQVSGETRTLRGNLFSNTVINESGAGTVDGAYNGYTTGSGRITPTNANDVVADCAFQSGPFGDYYQSVTSAFIDKGDTWATNVGLYHFTTLTNQVKEGGTMVDIGFHYAAASRAFYIGEDDTTQGNWKGVYGSDGYTVILDSTNYPPYATVTPSGISPYTWDSSPSDIRALQRSGGGRIAACWFTDTSCDIAVSLNDGVPHRVALYCVDWDNGSRVMTIQMNDSATGQTLDSRVVSQYSGGRYLIWDILGNITIHIIKNYSNAVLSGMFFSPGDAHAVDTAGNGIPDCLEDTNGNGVYDAGDLGNWQVYTSPNGLSAGNGLQVFTPLK